MASSDAVCSKSVMNVKYFLMLFLIFFENEYFSRPIFPKIQLERLLPNQIVVTDAAQLSNPFRVLYRRIEDITVENPGFLSVQFKNIFIRQLYFPKSHW